MIIYLTRHGQPMPFVDRPEGCREDPPLSALGRAQARRLGERLVALGFRGAIYASPYRRTAETADVIAATLGTVFHPAPDIRETVVYRGSGLTIDGFIGMTLAQLRERFPQLAPDARLPYPWWTREAETAEAVEARVCPFLDHLLAEGKDTLLIGHGASIDASVRCLLRDRPEALARVPPNWNCQLTAIHMASPPEPLLLMDTAHLPDDEVTSNELTRAAWQRERIT